MKEASLAPKTIYPCVMGLALALHFALNELNLSIALSSYAPVLFAAVCIAILEAILPFHERWLPDRATLKTDFLFNVFMQGLLPPLLLATAVFALLDSGLLTQAALSRLWVHDWPIWAQTVAMMLIIDFSTYWVHRALHLPALWRFHAVHHSVRKLYWLNVNHDHPVEAAGLYVFGAMPFVVLGVDERVLGLFIVLFGSHAFFQHCNIQLHFGVLNYLLSTPELHRWHHARDPQDAAHNFGNTLIVWDVLFGTWRFPYSEFHDIGVGNPNYPTGFLDQMISPLTPGLSEEDKPFRSVHDVLASVKSIAARGVNKITRRP